MSEDNGDSVYSFQMYPVGTSQNLSFVSEVCTEIQFSQTSYRSDAVASVENYDLSESSAKSDTDQNDFFMLRNKGTEFRDLEFTSFRNPVLESLESSECSKFQGTDGFDTTTNNNRVEYLTNDRGYYSSTPRNMINQEEKNYSQHYSV